jgi:hypothetical protein
MNYQLKKLPAHDIFPPAEAVWTDPAVLIFRDITFSKDVRTARFHKLCPTAFAVVVVGIF